jgi:hypothetical protein
MPLWRNASRTSKNADRSPQRALRHLSKNPALASTTACGAKAADRTSCTASVMPKKPRKASVKLEPSQTGGYDMTNETAAGSAGTPQRHGHPGGGVGQQSALQARAQFLKNRSWKLIIGLNQGACARGGSQHGFNSETQAACANDWSAKQSQALSLAGTIDFLRQCHRRAPFLFLNGNTFADVGRQIAAALFADLPTAAAVKSCLRLPTISRACSTGSRWSRLSKACARQPTYARVIASRRCAVPFAA